ncbi:unnamed protein product [Clonostachys solani]|uniref:Uncharacterized protein n=1 Tax=Clonostachys solani TaxID=160281 RepID=A0A9N9ZAW9_9HYPO|nr:unnamed protein product [Clonostachys solani]
MSSWLDDIDFDPGRFIDSVFDPPFNFNSNSPIPNGGTISNFDPGPSLDFGGPMPFGETLGLQGSSPGYSSSLSDSSCFASQSSNTPEEAMLLSTCNEYMLAQADDSIAQQVDEMYELARGIEDSSLITSYKAHPSEYLTTAPLSPTRGPGPQGDFAAFVITPPSFTFPSVPLDDSSFSSDDFSNVSIGGIGDDGSSPESLPQQPARPGYQWCCGKEREEGPKLK